MWMRTKRIYAVENAPDGLLRSLRIFRADIITDRFKGA